MVVKIYNYDSKTDGWKKFPGCSSKKIKIDMKNRGIRETEIEFTHYCKGGKTLCGEVEPSGSSFRNDVRNQCDGCREGLRQQTKEAQSALSKGDESINVIDYKVAEKTDHPEASRVSH